MAGMKQPAFGRLAAGPGKENELSKGNDHVTSEDPTR